MCVAFQEIVDLTADNIAKAPTKNLGVWGELIQEALDKSDEKVGQQRLTITSLSCILSQAVYTLGLDRNKV